MVKMDSGILNSVAFTGTSKLTHLGVGVINRFRRTTLLYHTLPDQAKFETNLGAHYIGCSRFCAGSILQNVVPLGDVWQRRLLFCLLGGSLVHMHAHAHTDTHGVVAPFRMPSAYFRKIERNEHGVSQRNANGTESSFICEPFPADS